MREVTIKLEAINDVKNFVSAVTKESLIKSFHDALSHGFSCV